jgi:hypothetical protein
MTRLGLNDTPELIDWRKKQRRGKRIVFVFLFLLLTTVYFSLSGSAPAGKRAKRLGFEPGDHYCAEVGRSDIWPQSYVAYTDLLESLKAHDWTIPQSVARDGIIFEPGWKIFILHTDWDMQYTKARVEFMATDHETTYRGEPLGQSSFASVVGERHREAFNKVIYTVPQDTFWKKCD